MPNTTKQVNIALFNDNDTVITVTVFSDITDKQLTDLAIALTLEREIQKLDTTFDYIDENDANSTRITPADASFLSNRYTVEVAAEQARKELGVTPPPSDTFNPKRDPNQRQDINQGSDVRSNCNCQTNAASAQNNIANTRNKTSDQMSDDETSDIGFMR